MTEVRFYHLQKQTLDQALPLILEKVYQTKCNAVVRMQDKKEVTRMDAVLWSYKENSFLPHGSAKNGNAARQPIWLTDKSENPNRATTLILTQGMIEEDLTPYDLCCEMLNGHDETAIKDARKRWKIYKEQGFKVTYWFQSDTGKWGNKT
jgi:DNA polymerase-3 subunit chi